MRVDLEKMYIPVEIGGVKFRNPFYVASGPTSKSVDLLVKAAQNGWAGASIKLTFDPEPYVNLDPRYGWFKDQGFLSFGAETRLNIEQGLRLVEEARKRTKDFVIIANITYDGDKPGVTGWVEMAKRFEAAGAHIIEMNMCCPNMSYNVSLTGSSTQHKTGASLGQDAEAIEAITSAVVAGVNIPVFVKLTPEGGRIAQVAKAAFKAGASAVGGTSNRLGVPMVDIYDPYKGMYHLQKEPSMSCLCGPYLRPLAFRDIYEIRKLVGKDPRIVGAGGITTLQDVVMAAMCGADLIQVCTGILLYGYEMLPPLVAQLKQYMEEMGYSQFSDMRDILVPQFTPATELTVYKGVARKKDEFLRAPCTVACPFNVPAQDYVTLVAEGDFQRAFEMISAHNPLQSICGWVCDHPCEAACTRASVDEAVRIRDIKRFVIAQAAKNGWKPEILKGTARDDKVAVIGSGPAGLSVAYHLARAGYKVTVYEAKKELGGMLRYAIPKFRLPEEVLEAELQTIREMGVEFVTGQKLSKDFTLDSLKAMGYKGIVLAVGTSAPLLLGIPGEEGPGCVGAVDFLDPEGEFQGSLAGKDVAIIGGGFTAMDSARTAIRKGAGNVYVLYRRTRAEMPATDEEVNEAEAEGVKIMYLVAPQEIIRENGRPVGIKLVNLVLGDKDSSGRRQPVVVEGTEFALKADLIISAVSQGIEEVDLGVATKNNLILTQNNNLTSVEGVYAAGDAVTGPDDVIGAIAGGYSAAVAVDKALSGQGAFLKPMPKLNEASKQMAIDRNKDKLFVKRQEVKMRPANERKNDFETYLEVMTEAAAVAEASRCLRCGCSVTCGKCEMVCTSMAVKLNENGWIMQKELCHACGMCAHLCPTENIEMVPIEVVMEGVQRVG
jgi:NADPH-dependent glutamate synthase beta subunit-like oxidoreductase/dihydroorotate dehydrogenase